MARLLSEYERPTKRHYEILLMSRAGWVFDFYDLILYTFLIIPMYLTFGFFANRFGRRPAYTAYSIIMASGLVMITLLWGLVAAKPPLILFFMFMVGFGTGMFSGYGPLFSEIFPTSIRNTAMGSAFNLARGVQFLTPVAIAVIAEKYGLGGGISLAAVFALLTGGYGPSRRPGARSWSTECLLKKIFPGNSNGCLWRDIP